MTLPALFRSDMDFSVAQNPTPLTIESGSQLGTPACVTVLITDDTLFESIENFTASMRPWTEQPVVISSPSSVVVLIERDPADG